MAFAQSSRFRESLADIVLAPEIAFDLFLIFCDIPFQLAKWSSDCLLDSV